MRRKSSFTKPDPERGLWFASSRTRLAEGFVTESMDDTRVAPLMQRFCNATGAAGTTARRAARHTCARSTFSGPRK